MMAGTCPNSWAHAAALSLLLGACLASRQDIERPGSKAGGERRPAPRASSRAPRVAIDSAQFDGLPDVGAALCVLDRPSPVT